MIPLMFDIHIDFQNIYKKLKKYFLKKKIFFFKFPFKTSFIYIVFLENLVFFNIRKLNFVREVRSPFSHCGKSNSPDFQYSVVGI